MLSDEYDRRNSWTPSIVSSSSSTTTSTVATANTNPTSWIERKLFSHFKRFFRRSSSPSKSDSSQSSRRPSSATEEVIALPTDEQLKQSNEEKEEEEEEEDNENKDLNNPLSSSSPSSSPISDSNPICEQIHSIEKNSNSTNLLYDYDHLLARCLVRQEQDRIEMISRCQTPVTIPHADLIVGHSRSILINWKSYVRLFRALNRDAQLFQQYINQYYACKSSINQREQLTFNARTTRTTFDNILKTFLDEYVTCLACQKARTHLIKSIGLWRIECQLCGSQRSVKRLRWKS
ncbi:unnamed protein product [Adineta steineri]|uniref:Eukaryotic translation initiation factor 2 subunit 2 n=1 Tax=Adineta steineri TaxID=433720 RepID=A0A815PFN2_9BILA|nr:unnamed protein product [Adineta steineri]CAF3917930.1 unnamed protein product [Adineta steineri]